MKVTRAQAEANRERIVDVAGELFREKGFDGIGLNELMQAAGLTRGGFYGHFESKDELAGLACERALSANNSYWNELSSKPPGDALPSLVQFYLSDLHCQHLAKGCAMAALAGDVARAGPELKATFETGVENFLAVLEPLVPGSGPAGRREQSLATLSLMVGALMLSRAVHSPELSAALRAAAGSAVLQGNPAA
jgi:TetR/AcrR family transcriptional repressor of nem operon